MGRGQSGCERAQTGRYVRTGSTVFFDPNLLTVADLEHSATEDRWFSVGIAGNGVLLSVVYLWSDADSSAIKVRLISARRATKAECGEYQGAL
jgi:uncharacterized DUF497 family protein